MTPRASWPGWVVSLGVAFVSWAESAPADSVGPWPLRLRDCVELALRQNHELRIERLTPGIARDLLRGSVGYYDPWLTLDNRWESATDSGGIDPTDFSRDAVYSAESEIVRLGLTGRLPTGLTYTFAGNYAHSSGERNLLNFDSYSVGASASVRQPLLRDFGIDAGRLLIRVNRVFLQITELGVEYLALDVVHRVHQAYYELAYARAHREVQRELHDARRRTLAGVERQIQQGFLAETEALPVRLQLATGETDLLMADQAVGLASQALMALLGGELQRRPGQEIETLDPLELHPAEVVLQQRWSDGLARRPDLQQLRLDVVRGELDLKFRRNQLYPHLDLLAGYGRRGASTAQVAPPFTPLASSSAAWEQLRLAESPNDFIGVLFSVPLSRTTERAAFRQSRQQKQQAELRVLQMEEQVLREIGDAALTVRLTRERAMAADRAAKLGAQAVDVEERKIAGGRSSLFFLLQLQGEQLSSQAAHLRARADHELAMAWLEFACGTLLDRTEVRIEVR